MRARVMMTVTVTGLLLLTSRTAAALELEVQSQGGVLTFPGEAAAVTTAGAQWGVLLGLAPWPALGVELSYQGAIYRTDEALSPVQDQVLENGAQAVVKVGPRLGRFEPYALGGLAVSHRDVRAREGGPGVLQDGALAKAPVGAGFDVRIPLARVAVLGEVGPSLLLGARGTYHFLLRTPALGDVDGGRGADQIGASVNLGARF
ncbi:hypothetical protein JQX13_51990 [Archangium violaceum]|uniref:hypothetical protein n=1 Tax=Archangium violaceum TaxID=83451 RepID=UPI00193B7AC3|nr:hypothetical protein [Archangium violaceum]QRK08350.1 hypothetical protein JQX13_51990 [Archangium violaceum]